MYMRTIWLIIIDLASTFKVTKTKIKNEKKELKVITKLF